ncbi:MAG: redox-regulated ATPase YchF [Myxococcota bacterium]|nr:redox-regulated ATPase YchF [Myxococcota bacterium]
MGLSVGIVGLPNVGKSTLFNALSAQQADAANYPFCTIDPNVGVVPVPDERFDALVRLIRPRREVPATVQFVDIAGLVRGASRGEGRGNAFLAHIREVDAIAHVVRCFVDERIVHVESRVDPVADIATIETELALKDLETVGRRLERARKAAKGADPFERKAVAVCERLHERLDRGEPARGIEPADEDERRIVHELCLLTSKPFFYVANVAEAQLATLETDPLVEAVRALAAERGVPCVVICAALEAEIARLPAAERAEFLAAAGLREPGLHQVIRTGYAMLDLVTFFTAGEPEVRAWTVRRGTRAPQAAGKIHSDFERGFIRAEVMFWKDLVELGSEAAVRAAGKLALEGKDYVVRDGDVIHFRFAV